MPESSAHSHKLDFGFIFAYTNMKTRNAQPNAAEYQWHFKANKTGAYLKTKIHKKEQAHTETHTHTAIHTRTPT